MLDDQQVSLEPSPDTVERVRGTALEVAEGIQSQSFEPKPSFAACTTCDFQLICPAADK